MKLCKEKENLKLLGRGVDFLVEKKPSDDDKYAVWLLLAGYLWVSLAGWARLVISLRDSYWYERFGLYPGLAYLVVSGAVWGVVGLAAFVWIMRGWRGYPVAGMAAALFLAVTYWGDRLAFSRPDGVWINGPFSAAATLLVLAYVLWILEPWVVFKRQ